MSAGLPPPHRWTRRWWRNIGIDTRYFFADLAQDIGHAVNDPGCLIRIALVCALIAMCLAGLTLALKVALALGVLR